MATILGNQGTALILQSRTRSRTEAGESITEVYRCDKDSADSLIASGPQFGDGHSSDSNSKLQTIRQVVGHRFSEITYTYQLASGITGTGGTIPDGEVVFTASANAMEIPIAAHPSWSQTWDDSKPGVQSYLVPQPTISYTWTEQDFVWTENNVAGVGGPGYVGRREKPIDGNGTVLAGATKANWLCVAREISPRGGTTVNISVTWQYASNGWDSDIYSDA